MLSKNEVKQNEERIIKKKNKAFWYQFKYIIKLFSNIFTPKLHILQRSRFNNSPVIMHIVYRNLQFPVSMSSIIPTYETQ